MMTEQEARSTIETYENTFGKELRRRTFRTWNDWAKAEEEFTPKDGSLQYVSRSDFWLASLHRRSDLFLEQYQERTVCQRSDEPTVENQS